MVSEFPFVGKSGFPLKIVALFFLTSTILLLDLVQFSLDFLQASTLIKEADEQTASYVFQSILQSGGKRSEKDWKTTIDAASKTFPLLFIASGSADFPGQWVTNGDEHSDGPPRALVDLINFDYLKALESRLSSIEDQHFGSLTTRSGIDSQGTRWYFARIPQIKTERPASTEVQSQGEETTSSGPIVLFSLKGTQNTEKLRSVWWGLLGRYLFWSIALLGLTYGILYGLFLLPMEKLRKAATQWTDDKIVKTFPALKWDQWENLASLFSRALQIREEENRSLFQALESTWDGVVKIDLEKNSLELSPRLLKLLDLDFQQSPRNLEEAIRILIHPDHPEVKTLLQDSGPPLDAKTKPIEIPVITKHQQKKWLLARGTLNLKNPENPKPKRWVVITDITDLKMEQQGREEAAQRFELAIQAANLGIWDVDLNTRKASVNPKYAEILGYDPEEFEESRDLWQLRLHPDDRKKTIQAFDDYLSGKTGNYRVSFRLKTKNHRWKWLEALGSIMERDPAGKPTRVMGTLNDITATRRLREQDRGRIEIQEQMDHGVEIQSQLLTAINLLVHLQPDCRCLLYLEKLPEKGPFLLPGEDLKDSFEDLILVQNSPEIPNFLASATKNHEKVLLGDIRELSQQDPFRKRALDQGFLSVLFHPLQDPDGSHLGALLCLFPTSGPFTQEDQEAIGFTSQMIRWIMNRHRTMNALKQSEYQFRALADKAPEGIFIQTHGCFSYVNDQTLKLFKVDKKEDLLGKPVLDKIHPTSREKVFTRMRSLNQDKIPQSLAEIEVLRGDGSVLEVETQETPFRFQGIEGGLVFVRDITERKTSEKGLLDSEKRFRTIFEKASEGILITDSQTRTILFANPAFCRMTQYSETQLQGMSVKNLHHPEILEEVEKHIAGCLCGQEGEIKELVCLRADGSEFECRISPVAAQLDGIDVLIAFFTDISESKKASRALALSEKNLAEAQALAKTGSFQWEVDTGKVEWSRELFPILGLPPETEPSLQSGHGVVYEEDRALVNEWCNQLASGNPQKPIRLRIPIPGVDFRHVLARGKILDQSKTPGTRILGTLQDITTEVKLNQAIQEKSDFFESFFSSPIVGVTLTNSKSYNVINANSVFLEMLGYSHNELPISLTQLIPTKNKKEEELVDQSLSQRIAPPPFEGELVRKDGSLCPVLIGITPIKNQTDLQITFVLDISARKAKERELDQKTWILGERLKELRTINALAELCQNPDQNLDEILQKAAALIGPGFQFPEIALARIDLRSKAYCSRPDKFLYTLSSPIFQDNQEVGQISAGYFQKVPNSLWSQDPFLPEETNLLKTLARILGNWISIREARGKLEQNHFDLLQAQKLSQTGSWIFDADCQKYQASPEFRNLIEANEGDLTRQDLLKLVGPEETKLLQQAWEKATKGVPYELEIQASLKNRKAWFHIAGSPTLDETGKLKYVRGITQDITRRKAQEEQIEFQKDLLNETGTIAQVGGWRFNPSRDEIFWTQEVYRIHELDLDYPLNLEMAMGFFSPRSRSILGEAVDLALNQGTPYDLELDFLSAKGTPKSVRTIGQAVKENGKIVGLKGVFQDITQRIKNQKELDRERALLQSILRAMPDPIWLKDEKSRYRFCNDRFAQMVGKTMQEVLGKTDLEISDRDLALFKPHQDELALEGTGGEYKHEEWRTFVNDGHKEYMEIRKMATLDSNGNLIGILGLAKDITFQKQAMDTLFNFNKELKAKVEERTLELATRANDLQMVIQSLPDTVLRIDKQGKLLFCQVSPDMQVNWKNDFSQQELSFPCGIPLLLLEESKELANNVRVFHEIGIAEKSIQGRILEMRISPLAYGESLVLIRDISLRHQLEEEIKAALHHEKELSAMKSRFIMTASHEFRTPMAAITGSADLLQNFGDRISPTKKTELLDRIQGGVDRLKKLVDDILNLSQVDSGKMEAKAAPCNLETLVKNILGEAQIADKEHHQWTLTTAGDLSHVKTDSMLVTSILSNLLSNAVRYSPQGGPIHIHLSREGNQFRIRVQDEGIGIPEADRAKLFQAFFRASNVGEIRGTGLGLNIVKKYTDLLGGKIELVPTDKGTCFEGTYPLG